MKPHRAKFRAGLLGFFLVVSLHAADTPAKPAPKPPPLSPRFLQVRERIGELFRHHDAPLTPAELRYDPFRAPGALVAPPSAEPGAAAPAALESALPDLTLLQEGVATLKVSGVFEVAGKQHLVINSRPYKEGDVVPAQAQGQPVYLRIRQIAPHLVTFALNNTEMTLKF